MPIELEICCYSLTSAEIAQRAGANRIELCGGLYEGGTTPSAGLIELTAKAIRLPAYVMIRPRGGDFCYTSDEIACMEADIVLAKRLGAGGIVFGMLTPDGKVDEQLTKQLVALAKPLGVTFHRAFDVAADPFEALESCITAGCERILTSAQQNKAIEGAELLAELVKKANGRIELMAGSGVNATNAARLAATGVNAIHLSGKQTLESPMIYRKENVRMASELATSEYIRYETSYEQLLEVKKAIS